jgi:predicted phage terminase large subunit-like protein
METMALQPHEYDALTRLDFSTFIERVFSDLNPTTPYSDNFHIHEIAMELEKLRRGEEQRLAVNVPPRNLKSIIVSVAYPAWLMGHDPTTKIISVSYSQELADILARQCRQVMQSDWYPKLFPMTRLSPSRQAADGFETTLGGFRIATSVDGTLTGLGADYILIDDPVNAQEALSDAVRTRVNQWYRNSLVTRLNDKATGRIVIVMQRLHEDDLVGHVLELEPWKVAALSAIATEPEVHVIQTPFGSWTHRRGEGEALHPDREPLSLLQTYRSTQGEEIFSAQFQQAPVAPGGNMIKVDQFRCFDLDHPPAIDEVIHSWDTASKATELSGFSVCIVCGITDRKLYLLDVIRDRYEYPDLRAKASAMSKGRSCRFGVPNTILIEDKSSGQSFIQDLNRENIYTIVPVKPESDKVTRMSAQTALIANGAVYLPREAPWLGEFQREVMAFPAGRYKDQVDALSQALKWFSASCDEPNMLKWIKMEVEKLSGRKPDDEQMVTLICKDPNTNVLYPIKADPIFKGNDGKFRMPMKHARPLLSAPQRLWERVDDE